MTLKLSNTRLGRVSKTFYNNVYFTHIPKEGTLFICMFFYNHCLRVKILHKHLYGFVLHLQFEVVIFYTLSLF